MNPISTVPAASPAAAPAAAPADGGRDRAALAAAAREVEALFARYLLADLADKLPGTSGGAGSSVYGDLFRDALAGSAAGRGTFGLSELLVQRLSPNASNPTSDRP